jgi:two-component system chemotaxis response regulator CheY
MFPPATKFLIVDDMATFRAMVKQALGELGYANVVEANDGEAGYQALLECQNKQEPVDVALVDWNMPHLNGLELLRRVRSLPWGERLPYVMITSEAEIDKVKAAKKLDVTGYLLKPVTAQSISTTLVKLYQGLNRPA